MRLEDFNKVNEADKLALMIFDLKLVRNRLNNEGEDTFAFNMVNEVIEKMEGMYYGA